MILPRKRGEVPAEELLGRRAFALAPWLVVSAIAVAVGLSIGVRDFMEHRPADTALFGLAAFVALLTAGLAAIQDMPFGKRYRRAFWPYAVGGASVFFILAGLAVREDGLQSVYYAGVCPLALYGGFVLPRSARVWSILGLVAVTVGVQLLNDATPIFDAVIVGCLVSISWFCGVLVATGHARIARISRRLSSYDRLTGSLNRRGFMQQLELGVGVGNRPDGPIALLLINLINFTSANEDDYATGDDLLAWVGGKLPFVLPDGAELGRLGDDEFAVFLPGAARIDAEEVARGIRIDLHEKISASVGVAVSETREVSAPDLYRVADAALQLSRLDPLGLHVLVAGTLHGARGGSPVVPISGARNPLSYEHIRSTGKVPRSISEHDLNKKILALSLAVVAIAGVPVVIRVMLGDGHDFYANVIRYLGFPWVAVLLFMAWFSYGRISGDGRLEERLILSFMSSMISIGVGTAALAGGGLTSPIFATVFVKVLWDGTICPRNRLPIPIAIGAVGWVLVAALGPTSALWVVPFHIALFGGSLALGMVGHRAMEQTGAHARSRAFVDDLTQLPNRAGFEKWATEAFFVNATTTGTPFGILQFRLSGLRQFNETRGHAAGDQLLRDVADLLVQRLPEHYVIGRTGASEFTAAVGMSKARDAVWLSDEIRGAIQDVVDVYVGYATCPEDGATMSALFRVAEQRVANSRGSQEQGDYTPTGRFRRKSAGVPGPVQPASLG